MYSIKKDEIKSNIRQNAKLKTKKRTKQSETCTDIKKKKVKKLISSYKLNVSLSYLGLPAMYTTNMKQCVILEFTKHSYPDNCV